MSDIGDQIERGNPGPEWEHVGPFMAHDASERIAELESELASVKEQSERRLRMLRAYGVDDHGWCKCCDQNDGHRTGCELAAEIGE